MRIEVLADDCIDFDFGLGIIHQACQRMYGFPAVKNGRLPLYIPSVDSGRIPDPSHRSIKEGNYQHLRLMLLGGSTHHEITRASTKIRLGRHFVSLSTAHTRRCIS